MNMPTSPHTVSRDEWLRQRSALLLQEKELTRQRDALAAARRRLPAVRVDKNYRFEGPEGAATLPDLFAGCRQLIVYHFMFAPGWDKGCSGCTAFADELNDGHQRHLQERDTRLVFVSRAPLDKLLAYRKEHGWTLPWYSSHDSDFNFDFHVTLDPAVAPVRYNYRTPEEHRQAGTEYYLHGDPPWETPGISCFLRDGDSVLHTYSTYGRGGEMVGGAHYWLDLTVLGRQEDWEDSPEGWPQRPTYG